MIGVNIVGVAKFFTTTTTQLVENYLLFFSNKYLTIYYSIIDPVFIFFLFPYINKVGSV